MADEEAEDEATGAEPEPDSKPEAGDEADGDEKTEAQTDDGSGSADESEKGEQEESTAGAQSVDDTTGDVGIRVYDFSHPQHRLGGQIPQLRLGGTELAGSVNRYIDNWLHISAKVSLSESTVAKYQEFVEGTQETSCIFDYKIDGVPSVALMSFDYGLILKVVEKYFGGTGSASDAPLRGYSTTETRLAIRLRKCLVAALNEVWEKLFKVSATANGILNRSEVMAADSESSVVAVLQLNVSIDEEDTAIRIALPWQALTLIRRSSVLANHANLKNDSSWKHKMSEQLAACEVDLHGQMAESRVTVEHLLKMQPGDFIPLSEQQSALFMVDGVPVFNAMIGSNKSQVSARFLNWIEQGEHST